MLFPVTGSLCPSDHETVMLQFSGFSSQVGVVPIHKPLERATLYGDSKAAQKLYIQTWITLDSQVCPPAGRDDHIVRHVNVKTAAAILCQPFQRMRMKTLSVCRHPLKRIFWPKDMTTPPVRTTAPGDKPRSIEMIAPEEIQQAAIIILRDYYGMTKANLIRETARLFGHNRTGGNVQSRVGSAIDQLIQRRIVRQDGDRVSMH